MCIFEASSSQIQRALRYCEPLTALLRCRRLKWEVATAALILRKVPKAVAVALSCDALLCAMLLIKSSAIESMCYETMLSMCPWVASFQMCVQSSAHTGAGTPVLGFMSMKWQTVYKRRSSRRSAHQILVADVSAAGTCARLRDTSHFASSRCTTLVPCLQCLHAARSFFPIMLAWPWVS